MNLECKSSVPLNSLAAKFHMLARLQRRRFRVDQSIGILLAVEQRIHIVCGLQTAGDCGVVMVSQHQVADPYSSSGARSNRNSRA